MNELSMLNDIPKRRQNILLTLILMLGAILRIFRLGNQSFWYDEVHNILLSAKSLKELLSVLFSTTPQLSIPLPPLYHILFHFWLCLRPSEALIRFPSVLFGIAGLWVVYLLGKSLLDAKHGLLCALLLAISPFHIWYSQEARMYSLLILLSAASTLFFIRFLQERKGKLAIWWAVMTVLAIYTHYHAAFLLVSHAAFFLFYIKKYHFLVRKFGNAILTMAIMGLPLLLLFSISGSFERVSSRGVGANPIQAFSVPYTFFAFSLGFSYGPSVAELHRSLSLATVRPYLAQVLPAALLFFGLFVLGLRSLWRERERLLFLLFYLSVPILGTGLISLLYQPISYNVRYVSAALPAYGLILARGLLAPGNRVIRWVLTVMFLIATLVSIHNHYYEDRYAKADYRSAALFVSAHAEDGDVILAIPSKTFKYYYRGPQVIHSMMWSPTSYREMIEERVHGFHRVWLVLSREWSLDPEGEIKGYIRGTFPTVRETTFSNLNLGLYDLPSTEAH